MATNEETNKDKGIKDLTEAVNNASTEKLQAFADKNPEVASDLFERTGTTGTIDAPNLENKRNLNIPAEPEPVVANNIISSTSIPPEVENDTQAQEATSSDATQLKSKLDQSREILDELGLGDIKDSFDDLLQKGAFTQRAEDEAGIGEKTIALNEIDSQLRETDLKFRRERERISTEAGLTKQQVNARLGEVGRKQASELADLSVIRATRRDDLATAQALVDRKVELTFEPIEQRLKFQTFLFEQNKDLFDTEEQKAFQIKMRDEQTEIDKDKFKFQQLENQKLEMLNNAQLNGASNAVLQSILGAEDLGGVISAAGRFGVDPIAQAQLSNIYSQISSRNADVRGESIELPQLTGVPSTDIANIIDATGAKSTQSMTNAINVISSAQEFAQRNPDGNFVGLAPIRVPGILLGSESRTKKQQNIGDIEAINLKTQQWASGAALTDAQTKQVKRLVPTKGDSDRQVRNKTNQLVNFMMSQVQGELAGQGINYSPAQVDFFNNDPLGVGTPVGDNDPLGINEQ